MTPLVPPLGLSTPVIFRRKKSNPRLDFRGKSLERNWPKASHRVREENRLSFHCRSKPKWYCNATCNAPDHSSSISTSNDAHARMLPVIGL